MKKPNPYFTLAGGVLIIAFAAILIRYAEAPGTVTAFYRLAIGASALAVPFFIYIKRNHTSLPLKGILLAILGGIFFGLDMAFWATGIVMSGAAIPTIMVNTAPLWVGLGALFIFREKQSFIFWAGVLISFVGSLIIMKEDLGDLTGIQWGGLFGSIAAVFYAGFHLVSQKARSRLNTLVYFWIGTVSASITLLIINIIAGNSLTGYSYETYLNFIVQGLIVQVFGWLMINYSQGYLPASLIAPSMLGQPVFTAILAWVLLGEELTVWQMIGSSVVLSGIYIVHHRRKNNQVVPQEL